MNMQMHYRTYTKHTPSGNTGLQAYGALAFHLDKFHAPYPTMPIFSSGHDFGHPRPFGRPTILMSLHETNCMKLASLRNPPSNLSLIVCNLETPHYKFTIFPLSASKLFSV